MYYRIRYILVLATLFVMKISIVGQDNSLCYGTGDFEFGIEKEWQHDFEVTEFQTLKVMDLDNDGIPEIIAVKNGGYLGGLYHFWDIVIINAQTHEIINEIKTCYFLVNLDHYVVLKDDSGGYEIIVAASDYNGFNSNNIKRKLICYRSDGSIKWISDHTFGTGQLLPLSEFNRGGSLSLADFNQDGIPEVYIFNEIFNARTGKKLAAGGKYGIGEIVGYHFGLSVAADMDDNPNDLELVAGYTIYKVKITNAEGLAGNEMTPYNMRFNGKLHDGWSVVADINDDGRLDVIIATFEWVNNAYQAFMYIYTLEKEDCVLIAKKDLGNVRRFSFPIVGNFSNKSESGIVLYTQDTLRKFSYNGSETLSEDWQLTTSQGGRYRLCLLAYDFDNDGVQEIIYRNFKSLKVINSVNDFPVTIGDITCYSNTTHDSPIIADIYNTGTSRICVTCADTTYGGSSPFIDLLARITIFGPPEGQQWAPARNIWHQYGYNPLFINDDGT
ncbi:MAG: hypothetical protein LC107_13945, partial [Chitinophagales bacterium]|nr:hypothetical protein [Chitinophagales bacterium]